MEGILFLVFWFGCAILHTFFDLKVKPFLQAEKNKGAQSPW